MLFITFDSENVTDHICVSVLKQYNLDLQTVINNQQRDCSESSDSKCA